jgi:protein-tyrosine phosphatase
MAQALLSAALPQAQVRSAGLGAMIGMPADDNAVRLMMERGLDITGHRAAQVTRQLCLDADLVLVMDPGQRERAEALYPQARGRIFPVGEYTKRHVPDPYRKTETAFREALDRIDEGLSEWLKRIRRL